MAKKLNQDQYWELDTAMNEVIENSDDYGVANGAHYLLIATLNNIGYKNVGRQEAMELAGELLSEGYNV